jgi:hypothetical protein
MRPIKQFINNFTTAWKRPEWRLALLFAIVSDILGFAFTFTPPVYWIIDVVTVIVLFVVIGFKWALLPALVVEAIPGLQLFPAWTLVVLALAGAGTKNKNELPP